MILDTVKIFEIICVGPTLEFHESQHMSAGGLPGTQFLKNFITPHKFCKVIHSTHGMNTGIMVLMSCTLFAKGLKPN